MKVCKIQRETIGGALHPWKNQQFYIAIWHFQNFEDHDKYIYI